MSTSNRAVLIGAAQFSERDLAIEEAPSPVDMLSRLAREAASSAGGNTKLLEQIDSLALTYTMGWTPNNAADLVASAIGAKPSATWVAVIGGETPLALLNLLAERVRKDESQLALVAGCNNFRSIGLARKAGIRFDWPMGGSGAPTIYGDSTPSNTPAESAVGLDLPLSIYPLYDNALRAARGISVEDHRRELGELFAPFSKVAASNPHAWFPVERSATELSEVTPANRMICFPYTKYLNSFFNTDQSAGALLASEDMARRLGVPESDWVYWRGGAVEVEDPWYFSERPNFVESPSLENCHREALRASDLAFEEMDHIDLYSCFPSAVSMACHVCDIAPDDPRGLTITGGLPYAGGPGNSYCLHAVATATELLRQDDGQHAFLTGNGWFLTKHSATVLSREPGPEPPRSVADAKGSDATNRVDWTSPPVRLQMEASGRASVETYTIQHGRDGAPVRGMIVGRVEETGERFLANTPNDAKLLESLEATELIGSTGDVVSGGETLEFRPH